MTDWEVVELGPLSPFDNMDSDYQKLVNLSPKASPKLRFYQWQKNAATFGYFLKADQFLQKNNLLSARRPTGGGIIFHDFDLSFSVIIPSSHPNFSNNTLENYAFVNYCLRAAIKKFHPLLPIHLLSNKGECRPHFCMARSTIYDLTVKGKKLAGGAMRKTNRGFLHQGSICLKLPDSQFLKNALKNETLAEEIFGNSFPLLQEYNSCAFEEQKNHLKRCLVEAFTTVQTNPFIIC